MIPAAGLVVEVAVRIPFDALAGMEPAQLQAVMTGVGLVAAAGKGEAVDTPNRLDVYREVSAERARQEEQWRRRPCRRPALRG